MKTTLALAALAATIPFAQAQSPIYGMNSRSTGPGGVGLFTSDTASFVANYIRIGANLADPIFALDFDETGTDLWAVNNTTLAYGTIDLALGTFTSVGTLALPGGMLGATGLTCTPNGTWYISQFIGGTGTVLYRGDLPSGIFTQVGVISPTEIIIDISADSTGKLYGHGITTDALFSIDTTTGAGTLIGPTGFPANFAQGMDFDWSDDTLYATVYTGGGTGAFVDFDLTTGAGNLRESTTPLNVELEMAVRVGTLGTNFCAANANSTGLIGSLQAIGSDDPSDNNVRLISTNLPAGETGYPLASMNPAFIPMPGGSAGNLCLGSSRARFVSLAAASDASGTLVHVLDLTMVPANPTIAITAPSTWHFQVWHRDGSGSNFTEAVTIDFN